MTKINKSLLTITLCTIFWFLTINAFAAKIIGCSNCSSSESSNPNTFKEPYQLSDKEVCSLAKNRKSNNWETFIPFSQKYVEEAAFRKLKCGLTQENPYFFPVRD